MKGNRVKVRGGSNKKYSGLEIYIPTEVVRKCGLKKKDLVDVISLEDGLFLTARIDKNIEEIYWGSDKLQSSSLDNEKPYEEKGKK